MNLYHVLLVDDEPFITASLSQSIPWKNYQCEVSAIASNGMDALSILETMQIDIVITDIRMQQMSGLELCQILYTHYPHIQIIVISGYAEFSYAQRAIQYGILGYCLKPLEYEEIGLYLTKAISRLNENTQSYNQDDLLNALLDEDITPIVNYLKTSSLLASHYYCAVFSGACPPIVTPSTEVMISIGKHQYGIISTVPFSTPILENFLKNPNNNCIGLSKNPVLPEQIPACMKECQINSLQYFISPECKIQTTLSDDDCQTILNQIASWLTIANSEQLLHSLHELSHSDKRNTFSVRAAMRLNNMICSSSSYSMQEETYYLYSIQQLLDRYPNFETLLHTLCQLIMNPKPYPMENSQITNMNFIKMMEFLNQNYSQNISTNDLAEYMHLNPSYLSKIFKQEIGTTVTKYITNLRILKAKQMLNSGNFSISEIATATGFNDYFYFLKTFKKITGMTPHQYQLGINENDLTF